MKRPGRRPSHYKTKRQALELWRQSEDATARCENIYMKWLLVRGAPELKIVREAA